MATGASPFQLVENGVVVSVHLTPKASRTEIESVAETADGGGTLRAKVTAAPEKGKANATLLKLLAKEWGIAPSQLRLISGEKDRRKRVLLVGDPVARMKELQTWLAERND